MKKTLSLLLTININLLLTGILLIACQSKTLENEALILPERPNILWLVAEDLSPLIPAFGDSTVKTPNLDRLAREGVRYTNAKTATTAPIMIKPITNLLRLLPP